MQRKFNLIHKHLFQKIRENKKILRQMKMLMVIITIFGSLACTKSKHISPIRLLLFIVPTSQLLKTTS